ncbi:epsilon antitoxin [Streptococcus phage phiJH1301-2]|nr:epsilon antitoxin [Streptococcus phage phiJH1301-2]QGJ85517.1 epsilon antitoxin [Streptococcus phage phi-SsuFJNP8_rum]URZ89557.1 Epsilon antitoxin [Streptococcus suis]URZ89692.1 Epsilon antitoxin [Streptococcus suis]URZ89758.1 Epsilon antitoxin [Streptococcus suis]
MAVTYEKTFEIEIINELSASVYNRVLNYCLLMIIWFLILII